MAVTIKRKAPAPAAQEYPRKGVHLEATPYERLTAHGYSGNKSGPLCNTGDGHYESTYLNRHVTCPCCIAYIVDKLRLPEYLTIQQWAIIGRDPLPGAPDADKGEAYPKDLPARNSYGRAGMQVKKPSQAPTERPQEATNAEQPQAPAEPGKAPQSATQSLYDDF